MKEYRDLLKKGNVVAVGKGRKTVRGEDTGEEAVVVNVKKKQPEFKLTRQDMVPKSVDGFQTDVVESGKIRAFYFLPVTPGVSIGHKAITAGTLGCFVEREGATFILSNNHVLANSNDAEIGDEILVPGPYDGGTIPDSVFAKLFDFVPLRMGGDQQSDCRTTNMVVKGLNWYLKTFKHDTRIPAPVRPLSAPNLVDAALAGPVDPSKIERSIPNIGLIQGTGEAKLDLGVHKMGRTTGYTEDRVRQTDVTCIVEYGPGQEALFEGQLLAGPMSSPGDSGSAVLDRSNHLVGLLFAGSDQVTIFSPIYTVLDLLNCHLLIERR